MDCKKDLICAAFEAILFSNGEPVPSERAAQAIGITLDELDKIADELIKKFDRCDSGIKIVKLGNKYQMCSKPEYIDHIQNFMKVKKNTPLSSAAMEVLSIIAYKQPVTKAFIDSTRGTDCREIINSLVKKSLIEEKGRLGVPGNPIIYGTTDKFLLCMGISSIEDLPVIPAEVVSEKA